MSKIKVKNKQWYLGTLAVVCFLLVWEFVAQVKLVDPLYIGTPHMIAFQAYRMFQTKAMYNSLLESGKAFFVGYFLAVTIGVYVGLKLGVKKRLYQILSPFIFTFNALPFVAILPLLIIWFGSGFVAKTTVVFLMVLSPVVIYTLDSTKTIDPGLLAMAKSFKADEDFKFRQLYFYHSLPYIFSGARVGIGRGLTAIVVSELYGLGLGIAYYIQYYGATYQTDKLMATILIIIAFNFLFIYLLNKLQSRVVFWVED